MEPNAKLKAEVITTDRAWLVPLKESQEEFPASNIVAILQVAA
jgi:hypothetical protein